MGALGFGLPLAAASLAGVGVVATAFLYGRFLERLARRALMLVFDLAFMYVGVMLLMLSQMGFWYAYAMLFVAVALCAALSLLFSRKPYRYSDLVGAEDSKRRSIKVKGNNHTLLMLGFMLGGSLLAFFLGYPPDVALVALGASVGLAGIFSLLLEQTDERTYKEALKKSPAFAAALLLLPLPAVPSEVQLGLVCLYTCFVSLNVIVLLNAVVETSRFDMISPVWLFGQEGSVFFAGIFAGGVLFSVGGLASEGSPSALYATCVAAAVVCAWMQIRVNYQIYPFEPVIETGLDDETRAHLEYGTAAQDAVAAEEGDRLRALRTFPRASGRYCRSCSRGVTPSTSRTRSTSRSPPPRRTSTTSTASSASTRAKSCSTSSRISRCLPTRRPRAVCPSRPPPQARCDVGARPRTGGMRPRRAASLPAASVFSSFAANSQASLPAAE